MLNIILLVVPVAVIVAAGYLSVRFAYVSQAANDGISRFVFAVALPAIIFRNMATGTRLPDKLGDAGAIFASYYLGALAVLLIGIAVAHFAFKADKAEQSIFGVGASHSNMVLLGVPAVLIVLGPKSIVPLALLVGLHGLVMAVLLTVVARVRSGKAGEIPKAIGQVALVQVKAPIFIALVLGILYDVTGAPDLPAAVNSILRFLGNAVIPCGLFALGGMLVRYRIGGRIPDALSVTVLKLVAHPLIVWVLAKPIFGLPDSWVWVAVMLALMPAGFNMFNMASSAKKDTATASGVVALSTILSLAAMVALVYIKN